MRSEIKRWGNSAAIRLPRGIAAARLDVSSPVTVVVEGRKIIIETMGEPLQKRLALPYSEADLVRGLNPARAHADELARPGGKDRSAKRIAPAQDGVLEQVLLRIIPLIGADRVIERHLQTGEP